MGNKDYEYAEAQRPIEYKADRVGGCRWCTTAQVIAGILLVICLYIISGAIDQSSELTADAIEKEARVKRVEAEPQLAYPLDYSARIKDCQPSGRECSRERFYFAKDAKK